MALGTSTRFSGEANVHQNSRIKAMRSCVLAPSRRQLDLYVVLIGDPLVETAFRKRYHAHTQPCHTTSGESRNGLIRLCYRSRRALIYIYVRVTDRSFIRIFDDHRDGCHPPLPIPHISAISALRVAHLALVYGNSTTCIRSKGKVLCFLLLSTRRPHDCSQESLVTMAHEVDSVLDIANAVGHPHGGPFVPQETYRPHTLSDRRRYVDEVQLMAPIMFFSNEPTGCGILLGNALSSTFNALEGRDDAMLEGSGPSVSIKLNVRYSFPSR